MTAKLTPRQVLLMILCNYFPFFHLLLCILSLVFAPGATWKTASSLILRIRAIRSIQFLVLFHTRDSGSGSPRR